jgi:hypothetical protein
MHVGVRVPMGRLVAVRVRLVGDLDRYQNHATMANAPFGDHMLGAMLDVARPALEYRDLHAAFVVEMNMQRCMRHVVMIMKGMNEPLGEIASRMIIDVDQSGNAIATLAGVLLRLLHSGSGQVPDRLGPVLIAALCHDPIEVGHEIVVERNGDTLHGELAV